MKDCCEWMKRFETKLFYDNFWVTKFWPSYDLWRQLTCVVSGTMCSVVKHKRVLSFVGVNDLCLWVSRFGIVCVCLWVYWGILECSRVSWVATVQRRHQWTLQRGKIENNKTIKCSPLCQGWRCFHTSETATTATKIVRKIGWQRW